MIRLCRLRLRRHGDDGQWAYEEIVKQRKQIEALTAQVGVLRDGLKELALEFERTRECGCLPMALLKAHACIASTPESALRDVLKAERERILDRISAYFYLSENFKALAEEVRSMGDE